MVVQGFCKCLQLLSYFVRCLPTRVNLMYSMATSMQETETKIKRTIRGNIKVSQHLNGKYNWYEISFIQALVGAYPSTRNNQR